MREATARRRASAWLVTAVFAICAVAFALARVGFAHVNRSATGVAVGRLPAWVRMADLNLLVITLDTTRADRLGAYGWPDSVTPAIDSLARQGILFERAVSAAPLTLPSHSSMFTGKYPPRHGVRDNGGFTLDRREITLAERLVQHGFKTGGFIGAYVLDRRWGLARGFDTYFDEFEPFKARSMETASLEHTANEVVDHAVAWLDTIVPLRFFAWLHFYDPHVPYAPPEPYRTRFADRPYLGELAFVDSQVRRLVAFLEQRDLLRKTIVVLIGDHGESLGEHGEQTHGFFAYDGVVRVPFIIVAPFDSMRGRRVSDLVRTIDLAPTALDLLGIGPPHDIDGRSVVALMTGAVHELELDAYSEAVYARYHYGWGELYALSAGRYKYIDAPRPELYDLQQDPHELTNVYPLRRQLADRMAAAAHAISSRANHNPVPTSEIDPDARARLAALGYVGTFGSSPRSAADTLPDPKDKIELFNLLIAARELLQDADTADAGLEVLHRVLAKDSNVIDAWLLTGNELERRRQFTDALGAYRRAAALKPDYDLAVFAVAQMLQRLGRSTEALGVYRQLSDLNPRNAEVHQEIAQLLIDSDRLERAEDELATALALKPMLATARNSLGALRLRQGHIDEGEREIRTALQVKPDLRLAHFNLAIAAERRGDTKAAIAEYEREVGLYPDSYMAYFNLGKVYEQKGDHDSQLRAYRAAIESNPEFSAGYLFLAKLYVDMGQQLDQALMLARRGLELAPNDQWGPLGHFVIADVYARQGRTSDAAREVSQGRMLETRTKR